MGSLVLRYVIIGICIGLVPLHAQEFRVDTVARAPQIQFPSSIALLRGEYSTFLFAEKSTGAVRLYRERLIPLPFVTVPVDDEGEQGLLGVAVHPSYPDSPYVYLYYVRALDRASVLERYTDVNGTGSSPELLLFIPRRDEATHNNGGRMAFGPDGKLYLAVGDHGVKPANAQDTLGGRNLRGKILRLNPDGTIPEDNILPRRYFWSLGVRNPGGLAIDPGNGKVYLTEGGTQFSNSIAEVPGGANLGWPGRRPSALPHGSLPRVLYNAGRGEQPALTGIAVYRGEAFPRLRGSILCAGNAIPKLWQGIPDVDGDSLRLRPLYSSNTGFSDVQVGDDGNIYVAVGPYLGSRILRLSPLLPHFASDPPIAGVQGVEYRYVPRFTGTPPALELVAAPEGMRIDSAEWSLRWTPTNAQALEGMHQVVLRARNGAGGEDQRFVVTVKNMNDPPLPFALRYPVNGAEFRFLGEDPVMLFAWAPAVDPDGDSLRYTVQLDTVDTFGSAARMDLPAGGADSLLARLPSASREFFWRVAVTDGRATVFSSPPAARIGVIVSKFLGREKTTRVEPVLEKSFPKPVSPGNSLRYTLPRGGRVRLMVFNLLGQEVATLVDRTQAEGTYEVAFAGVDLPSGIYFYRLVAPGFAETKKVVIAK
jgi:glucose/arabinose dehydrogenase